jgi:CRP-like cAMP-binding protein
MVSLRKSRNPEMASMRDMDLFSDCKRGELARIGSLTTMVEMKQGSVLIEEGQVGLEFFVVMKGRATASRDGLWLAEFGPGSFFGELALLFHSFRTATVVADTDMTLFVCSRTEFSSLQRSAPSVVRKMSAEMSRRIRRTHQWLEQQSACAPSRRGGIAQKGTEPQQRSEPALRPIRARETLDPVLQPLKVPIPAR